jgi:hypothetical protein
VQRTRSSCPPSCFGPGGRRMYVPPDAYGKAVLISMAEAHFCTRAVDQSANTAPEVNATWSPRRGEHEARTADGLAAPVHSRLYLILWRW